MPTSEERIKLAENMLYHEHLAQKCERGTTLRQYHEDRAQQYRDELLCNPPRTNHGFPIKEG